jgi:ankyrin repeat protein
MQGNAEVVKLLLTEGKAEVNKTDKRGKTPLYIANLFDHDGVVELLLANGAIPEAEEEDSEEDALLANHPLCFAANNGDIAAVTQMINENKAEVNMAMDDGRTPLFFAVENGHTQTVALLVKEGGADVNRAATGGDMEGMTPLVIAVASGQAVEIVALLVTESNVDVNQEFFTGPFEGMTLLGIAVESENTEAAECLLANGATPFEKFTRGNNFTRDDLKCPARHTPSQFSTPHEGFGCDVCEEPVPKGADMFGCDVCDWDMCNDCAQKAKTEVGSDAVEEAAPRLPLAEEEPVDAAVPGQEEKGT